MACAEFEGEFFENKKNKFQGEFPGQNVSWSDSVFLRRIDPISLWNYC